MSERTFNLTVTVSDPSEEFETVDEYGEAVRYALASGLDQLELQYKFTVAPPPRQAPDGSSFLTLFVAYLFEDKSQFLMYDEGETDLREVIDNVHGSPVSLIAWNKRSGFPTPQDFEKFQRDVTEEFGDIPFVD